MEWIEIAVPARGALADELAALLAERVAEAASGVELRADAIVFWVEVGRAEGALADTRAALAELADAGFEVDPGAVRAQPAAPESTWKDAYKHHFRATRVTRRLVIVPSWERYEPGADDLVIHMDPGMAFGTGAHASTQLCMELMQQLADADVAVARMWDLGCGSGILAIAARLLWPEAIALATDNDPDAVAVTRENVELAGMTAAIECSTADAGAVAGPFDLVVANIQRNVLLALRDDVVARVAAGGHLILSGLLTEQAPGVAEAYAGAGLQLVELRRSAADPEWTSVLLRGPGAA